MRRQQLGRIGGLVALVAALVLVVLPEPPGIVERYSELLSGPLVFLALVVATLGLRQGYRTVVRHVDEPPFEQPPETATAYDNRVPGDLLNQRYEKLRENVLDSEGRYEYETEQLKSALRTAAVEVVADARGISNDDASEAVADGTWTDDVRASAFIGETERPLEIRIRDWASGRTVERQVEHTLAAIERLAEIPDDEGGADATDQAGTVPDDDPVETKTAVRGGGVEAGELAVTDHSERVETTVTTADAETSEDSHWEVGVVVAFLLAGIGFLLTNAVLVLAAIVPAGFAVYGSLTRPPEVTLDVERVVSDGSPVPGEPVDVSLTVTNVGDRPIAELRVVDGVPDSLRVVDGSPRRCVSLGPGESTTATYTVEAFRGSHAFEGASLWARNVSGEVERSCTAHLETSLDCRDTVETMPTTSQTTPYQGRIETDSGGAGLEFYATREHQSNDPLGRIDWNYWAQTGEPRTIEFRQTHAGTVVVVLDDRSVSRKARDEFTPDAVTLGRHAAVRIADALLDESNAVGGALLTAREYERPSRGREQRQRLRTFFAQPAPGERASSDSDEASSPYSLEDVEKTFFSTDRFGWVESETETRDPRLFAPDGGGIPTRWLRNRLPGRAQVVFVSPLLDDAPRRFLRTLQADGIDVTVLSPDVTETDTPGGTVERIKRHERLRGLRRRQFRIVDWAIDRPLSVALERAQHRWSR